MSNCHGAGIATEHGNMTCTDPQCQCLGLDEGSRYDQPELSPYTSRPIGLCFGKSRKMYTVSEHLAKKIPGVAAILKTREDGPPIQFLDVDEDIGHSVVHYLYTGQYQTTRAPSSSTTSRRHTEYITSVHIYSFAVGYHIKGLEALAKHYMLLFEDSVDIFQILSVAKKEYRDVERRDNWYPKYLVKKIRSAFAEDEDVFKREELLDVLGEDGTFDQFLIQTIVSLYSEKVSSLKTCDKCEDMAAISHHTEPESEKENQPVESQSKSVFDFWFDHPSEAQSMSQAETEYGSDPETMEAKPLLDGGSFVCTPSTTESGMEELGSDAQSSLIDDEEFREMVRTTGKVAAMIGSIEDGV